MHTIYNFVINTCNTNISSYFISSSLFAVFRSISHMMPLIIYVYRNDIAKESTYQGVDQ